MGDPAEILIVTGDDGLAAEIEGILGEEGLACERAVGRDEALGTVAQGAPIIALVDGLMGDGGAVEICADLRRSVERTEMGILVLVSEVEDRVMADLLSTGADDVVSRRVRPLGLKARISSHVSRVEAARELARNSRDADLLVEVTSRLVGTEDLRSNLYRMAGLLARELEIDRCSVVLVRPEIDYGLVIASSDDPEVRDLPISLERYPEIRRVTEQRSPLVVDDVAASDLLEEVLPSLRDAHVTSVALFPIAREEGEVLGVIFLRFAEKREAFEQRELVFCQTVANATAIALRNAEIQEMLRAKTLEVEQVQTRARTQMRTLERYGKFLESSADGIVVLDGSGVVLFANPRSAAMIGRHERELCGYPFARLLSDEDQDRLERLMGQGSKWEAHRAVDFSIRRDGGDEVLLSISAGALGEGGMIVLTMRDVTEERRMAQRLAEAREKLIQSEKQGAMMEVAGAAAHELNQPLTSVMTSVAMLKRIQGDGEGPASRLIETMEQETERMASIIRRLSTITRYTTKSYVGEARIIDLEGASGGGADAGGEE